MNSNLHFSPSSVKHKILELPYAVKIFVIRLVSCVKHSQVSLMTRREEPCSTTCWHSTSSPITVTRIIRNFLVSHRTCKLSFVPIGCDFHPLKSSFRVRSLGSGCLFPLVPRLQVTVWSSLGRWRSGQRPGLLTYL